MNDLVKTLKATAPHYQCAKLLNETADLIEQQQKRIAELEQALRDLGYCTVCSSVPEHHLDEPFSSCNCGTSEDYATRPLQKAQHVQQHNNELAATIERLRHHIALIRHKVEIDARKEVLLSVIGTIPQQNLNAIKREVAKRAIVDFGSVIDTSRCNENDIIQLGEEYANETYPDKDDE